MKKISLFVAMVAIAFTSSASADDIKIGNHFAGIALTANQSTVLVTAAQNTGGISLKSASWYMSGNGGAISLIATCSDNVAKYFFSGWNTTTNSATQGSLTNSYFIPAGCSLTARQDGGGSGVSNLNATYDLLN